MKRWLMPAGLALLTALSYANAAPRALVHDDHSALVLNPKFGGAARIPELFRESVWEGVGGNRRLYRPLAMASLALDRTLYGGDPRGYHATSILLHVAATVVLFALLSALGAGGLPGFLAALLFGVHPIHTEAVDVAFNRSEILACLGVLAALLWLWRFVGRRPLLAGAGAGLLYLLALLSRESAVTLPLLAALCLGLLWPGAEPRRRLLAPVISLAIPLGLYLWLREVALGETAGGVFRSLGPEGVLGSHSPLARIALVAATLRDYWRMLIWPWPLRTSHEDYVVSGVAAALVLHLALLGLAVAARRRFPALSLGLAFFYAALLPSTRLFADPAVLAERFVYLPSAGPAIPLAFGLAAWAARRGPRPALLAGCAVAVILAFLTLKRNAAWHSPQALWEAEARASQDDWRVMLNLSQVRLGQRRYEEAIALCDRGLALGPPRPAFQTNRGIALTSLGRHAEAEAAFTSAAEQGRDPAAFANLARLYATTRRSAQADTAYLRAMAQEPDAASRLALDGERLLLCHGDVAQARASFERALALSPGQPAARRGLLLVDSVVPAAR